MPAPDDQTDLPVAAFEAALASAGVAPSPTERELALASARRLRRAVMLLRAWIAETADDAA